ncbi:DUF1700 domain-containing protein [Lactonifactor longoviformis]|uniref:DUF1700 domain-containing protein n=1 Tax=Lactonifactor TaxID=420345 RepID=UPI00210C2855|nr:DUF1700 domain-containing protein [Lactonifactor longoviformis]
MNKEEYMSQMRHNLRRLPKEDFDKAIEYFEEYFAEAGPEQEGQAIEDLGSPDTAADEIIRSLAVQNAMESQKSVKRGVSAVWVGILAVFAAPIGLPLAFAAGVLALSFVLVIFCILFALIVTAVALALSAIPLLGGSLWLLFTSPINGLASTGLSLIAIGIGFWVVKGCLWLSRRFLNGMTGLFGKIARKGKKHESEK